MDQAVFDETNLMLQSSPPMRLLGILLALATANAAALAQTNRWQPRSMSLEDCMEIALHHNLDVLIKRYTPEINRYTLSAVYGAYDPSFFARGEHDYSLLPGGIDAQDRPYSGNESESDVFRLGLQGLLPWGTTYSLSGNLSDTYGTQAGTIPGVQTGFTTNTFIDANNPSTNISFLTPTFSSVSVRNPFENTIGSIGITLTQPLLKNFWIDSTRLQILIDKAQLKISELDLRFTIMNTVFAVEQAYDLLIYSQDKIRVQQRALELAEQQLAENKKRVEVGAMAPLDEKQAESQAAQSRADLLAALGAEETQQRVLKKLLSDDYSKWETVSIQPTIKLIALPQKFDLQESWRKGMKLRPDLIEARLSVDQQGHRVRFQRNQLFPQLDAVGSYGYNAGSKEFSGALDQFAGRNNPFWTVGAQLTIPLANISARNNYRVAKATKEQIALQLHQDEQNVLIQIENDVAAANTSFQQVDATREARIYAEAALDAEKKKLESGKSTSFIVLQLTKDLTTAENAEINALATYNIALALIALDEGTILERQHITLEMK
jgi:outer membrane protein TolC